MAPGRAPFWDRLALRMSEGSVVDGVWIGSFTTVSDEQTTRALARVGEALQIIHTHAPRTYARLQRDLSRIWLRLLDAGPNASYSSALSACQLDERFVLDADTTVELLAATIVHEATHARLDRCGIAYSTPELRSRVEAACRQQELAFASRLPDGARVRERAEKGLARPLSDWTDAAMGARYASGDREALRYLGLPAPVVKTLSAIRQLFARRRSRSRSN